jgi:hypothetical protein
LVDLLTALILVVDLILSIWNSYTAGFTFGMLRKKDGPSWMYVSPILGLAIGLVGAIYVTAIVASLVAYWFALVGMGTVNLLLTYNFLIAGGLITVLGIGVTVQSIYIAIKRPGVWTVAGALYNTFASIWNIFVYMRNFGPAVSLVNYERQNERKSSIGALIILAAVVTVIGVLLSYIAFHAGRNHANGAPVGMTGRNR